MSAAAFRSGCVRTRLGVLTRRTPSVLMVPRIRNRSLSTITTHSVPFAAAPSQHQHASLADQKNSAHTDTHSRTFAWCVVGAGPAGIACVGQLIDRGVAPSSILWVDPAFAVGDFGTLWRHVSSNTTVGLFRRFFRACRSFQWRDDTECGVRMRPMDDKDTCKLDVAAAPLREITQTLRASGVQCVHGRVTQLKQVEQRWEAIMESQEGAAESASGSVASIVASSVILCTGAEPRIPTNMHAAHPHVDVIPLSVALNPTLLARAVSSSDTVCIVGSSHTAVLLLRALLTGDGGAGSDASHRLPDTCRPNIINLYLAPLRYALYMDDWILFDDTGLKGSTAAWARDHLHDRLPAKLQRVYSSLEGVRAAMVQSTKVIYATGFEKRELAHGVEGVNASVQSSVQSSAPLPALPFNPHCGIIAPGLFGCGIGFPEQSVDRYGNVESRVGLWKFMAYVERVMPLWMQYAVHNRIGQPKGVPAK